MGEELDDAAFVRLLVMETVMDELGAASWPEALRGPLLEVQYQARMKGLRDNFPDASPEILRVDGEAAGWLVIARREAEIRLVDIAVSHSYRGRGLASRRIQELLAEADSVNKPVRLSVGVMNPAVRLYERLGFQRTGGDPVRHFMEWRPRES